MATTIEQRLEQAERIGEKANRVIDLFEPRIGAIVRIVRGLVDKAKARGENVVSLEEQLAVLDAGIVETQAIVDEFKALRAAERAAAPAEDPGR